MGHLIVIGAGIALIILACVMLSDEDMEVNLGGWIFSSWGGILILASVIDWLL